MTMWSHWAVRVVARRAIFVVYDDSGFSAGDDDAWRCPSSTIGCPQHIVLL